MREDRLPLSILSAALAVTIGGETIALEANGKAGAFAPELQPVVEQVCSNCHNPDDKKGNLDLEKIPLDNVNTAPDVWEKVVRRLRARQMPPAGKERPDEEVYQTLLSRLESALDQASAAHPNPGRTETFRRLNRTEYQNAIRDLLALEIDAATLLAEGRSRPRL